MHFDWSPDGTQLLAARGPSRRNVFLRSKLRQVVRRCAPSPATERAKVSKSGVFPLTLHERALLCFQTIKL